MNEYLFERVTPEHYQLLKDLYADAFNIKISVGDIQKRHNTSELGHPHIGFIAIQSTTRMPAAYYGVFPVKLIVGSDTILAAQSADTMTHREHRNKGLFTSLARLTFDACSRENIELVFGFPNDNSYPGFISKLNWTRIDNIARYDLKLKIKTLPLARLFRRAVFLRKLHHSYARFVLRKKIVPAPGSFTNNYPTHYGKVQRDEKYIRYKQSPDKLFVNIDNRLIWIKLTDVLWVGDIDNYESVTVELIRKIKRIAFKMGYNTITFNFNESLEPPGFLQGFKKHSADTSCILRINVDDKPENILFTGADFDTW